MPRKGLPLYAGGNVASRGPFHPGTGLNAALQLAGLLGIAGGIVAIAAIRRPAPAASAPEASVHAASGPAVPASPGPSGTGPRQDVENEPRAPSYP
jgi:hypothetical protein